MRQIAQLAAVVIAVVVVTGCAPTMSVSSHVGRGVDFARYRTYDWGPADALPAGDPRLDQNPFFQDRMQGAVEKQLAIRGFERSASGTPDLLVHYHASIDRRLEIHEVDARYGHCDADDCQSDVSTSDVSTYEAATLMLDLVDTHTNDVIWRGWAQDRVAAVLDDPDKMARQISEAVERMLARLRPAQRGR